jgi:hypothetical protein
MSEPEQTASTLTAEVFEAWKSGLAHDQLAAKMFQAAVCLSVEQIGPLRTIDGIVAVLACLSEEFPGEFASLRIMHGKNLPHQHWPRA